MNNNRYNYQNDYKPQISLKKKIQDNTLYTKNIITNELNIKSLKLYDTTILNSTRLGDSVVNSSLQNLGIQNEDLNMGSFNIDNVDTVNANFINGQITLGNQTGITELGTLNDLTINGDLLVDPNTFYVDSTNNEVGIGTTNPRGKLDIVDSNVNVSLRSTSQSQLSTLYFGNTSSNLLKTAIIAEGIDSWSRSTLQFCFISPLFSTNAEVTDTKMTIKSNGNVGIGVSNPSYTLDVNGDIGVTGNVFVGTDTGQFLNGVFLNDLSLTGITISSTDPTLTEVYSYSYTPKSDSSKIISEFTCSYAIPNGYFNDSYYSYLDFNGTVVMRKEQVFTNNNGGGTRSGVLFPIKGVYTNTSLSPVTITIYAARNAADDSIVIVDNDDSTFEIIEITN